MAASLNNVATQDGYVPPNELNCEGAEKLTIQVYNAGIFYSYLMRDTQHPRGTFWSPETFLAPATYFFARNAEAVKVRSAVIGKPAQVTIEALP